MPRIILKRRPSASTDSPGLSSVPASIEPIITHDAPEASAFTMSPEYLMPPSATIGTSPAPRTASITAVICGTPTPVTTRVVQMLPGPMPTFTASTPRRTSSRAPSSVATLPATSCTSGKPWRMASTVMRTPSLCPCAESMTSTSTPDCTSAARAGMRLGPRAQRGGDAQAAVLVLVGVGVFPALEDVLHRDEPAKHTLRVHHRQLLDAMLRQDALRLIERRADRAR